MPGFYDGFVQAFAHRQGLAAMLADSPGLAAGQQILDAGCGSGLSIRALSEAGPRNCVPGSVHRLCVSCQHTWSLL
jgi:predicted nicotinamide N-methyase